MAGVDPIAPTYTGDGESISRDQWLSNIAHELVKSCEEFTEEASVARIRATEYYDGIMTDTPADTGRSQVVSRDVRSVVKKIMPSVTRVILGNDEVVECQPVGEGDEGQADQASDYVNFVVIPQNKGRKAIRSAIHDAIKLRNGILKSVYEEMPEVQVSHHTGLDDQALGELAGDDDVEILTHDEKPTNINAGDGQGSAEIMLHDVKLRRTYIKRCVKIEAVPLEEFLIHPSATCVEDSPIVGQRSKVTRSDLIKAGYDKGMVENLPAYRSDDSTQEEERDARRMEYVGEFEDDYSDPSMEEIDYYELYIRADFDEDGIGELRRVCFGGDVTIKGLLKNEECDIVPFGSITGEDRPHQWEGVSTSDDAMEIQQIKTVLLRQTLDNTYWQNNLQPVVKPSLIKNMDAVNNPGFGEAIEVADGAAMKDAIDYNVVPFVARDTFSMLSYLDEELVGRTGISDVSAGLSPDAMQNMTATASSLLERAGIGQTEMVVHSIAEGLASFFKIVIKMVTANPDMERTIRLRGEWITLDPRHWNSEMDITVNTGLGAGTRERDMAIMKLVISIQKDILAQMGADNPYVKPDNLFNSISKLIESSGLRSSTPYFTKPNPAEVQKIMEKIENRPDPEETKTKAQIEIEKAKVEANKEIESNKLAARTQLEQAKMVSARDKESAQMEADLRVKQFEMEKDAVSRQDELQSNARIENEKIQIAMNKLKGDLDIQQQKLELEWAKFNQDVANNEAELILKEKQIQTEPAQMMENGNATE